MHAYAYAMVKVISLSNKAYSSLKSLKRKDESFSEIVLKLVDKGKKASLLEFAGIWKSMPEMDRVFEDIINERHKAVDRKISLKW